MRYNFRDNFGDLRVAKFYSKGGKKIPVRDTMVICLHGHGGANKSPNPTT